MRSTSTGELPACFTRLVIDGQHDLEVVELARVMEHIQGAVQAVVPPGHRCFVSNALLNLAVNRMLSEMGTQRAATLLIRLVDAVLEHEPNCECDGALGARTPQA